jgi:ribonuclease R
LKPEPLALQKVQHEIKGRPEEQLISLLLLRSMKHARYAPQDLGHFGLASRITVISQSYSPLSGFNRTQSLKRLLDNSLNARRKALSRNVWEIMASTQHFRK